MEALEKAKRLRESRSGATGATGATGAAGATPGANKAPAVSRRNGLAETISLPVLLDFPRLSTDQATYEASRVLFTPDSDNHSVAFDAYRILRTRLGHRISAERWNSLAITSTGPGEGKSVTALNLSLAIAREGKRNVFLLDLDLRNPSLCRYLGVEVGKGIGDYLAGAATLEEIFFSIGVENLTLAGGRTSYKNSAELLGGERLRDLITSIGALDPNALVIADLPPLLNVADALVVAPRLSATLLVVAEGKTRREGLAHAIEILGGVTVAGIVLNHSLEAVDRYYG
jgi:capsular exopolysaccharide synthesis family protein